MIGLDLVDEDAIKFISKFLNNHKYSKIPPKKENLLNKYRIQISGKNRIEQLKRFGIHEKKTFNTEGCSLTHEELEYLPFILRGIIDGDGWIRKDGKEFFISSASFKFIQWCKKSLEYIGFLNLKITYQKNEFNGIYLIRTGLKSNISLLKEKIYFEENFGMNRKRLKLFKES